MSSEDCVIAVCSADENIKEYIISELKHNNTIFCSSIEDIKKLKYIDILIVCDTMVKSIKRHLNIIKSRFNKIKIICVIKNDPLLSNELISMGCDGIIRKVGQCTDWISNIINKVNTFKRLYEINMSMMYLNDRRKNDYKPMKNGRRRIDHINLVNANV